ncbi:hypothetical protein RI129_000903 [Pyrocoelia pectoralis]|uniref:Integrase SAM-like N-terminal domain-containing protein n=1 Tax=Pyrocoelia pectoralis TaxID=417401 RepID=A0AAN7VUC3_9COLE
MSKCESDSLPSDVEEVAKAVVANLLPSKSKAAYETAYSNFQKWCGVKEINIEKTISEKVLLAYFSYKAKVFRSSTMWSHYSIKFTNLIAFLKRNAEGYRQKKSK